MAFQQGAVETVNLARPRRLWDELQTSASGLGKLDGVVSFAIFLLTFCVYIRNLAPSIAEVFDDTLELQLVSYQLGIAHPTGYPLYTLLGKIFTFLPFGDIAFRVNLMSAFWGSLATVTLYCMIIEIVGKPKTRGEYVTLRTAAAAGTLAFAFSAVFWSQAVIAEVYTLNILLICLVLYIAFKWRNEAGSSANSHPYLLAFVSGLSLTHHRMSVLVLPAIAVLLWQNKGFLPFQKSGLRPFVQRTALFLLPLTLYLYLPIRGLQLTSLDGTYQNTLGGFIGWVTGSSFGVFLTSDPWSNASSIPQLYVQTLISQFGPPGVVLSLIGVVWLLASNRTFGITLLTAYAFLATFGLFYRVSDHGPFFLPSFMVAAIFMALGMVALLWTGIRLRFVANSLRVPLIAAASLTLVYLPYSNYTENVSANNLSRISEPRRLGLDILSQPMEKNASVVGILGEITLIRYFQETEGMRQDIKVIPADDPKERLETISRIVGSGNAVYTTRPLDGMAERYPLSSLGPLIKVRPQAERQKAEPLYKTSSLFDERILLLGYDLESKRLSGQQVLSPNLPDDVIRLTLYWQPLKTLDEDYSIFVHILDSKAYLAGQKDGRPVHDSYPTKFWRPGEIIADTVDVPLKPGTTAGSYSVDIGLYKADGQRLKTDDGKQSLNLDKITLGKTFSLPYPLLQLQENPVARYSNGISLLDATLNRPTTKPGEKSVLELLWKAERQISAAPDCELYLIGENGNRILVNQGQPVYNTYPPIEWEQGEVVLDRREIVMPASAPPGDYSLVLALGREKNTSLARLEIEGRPRSFELPDFENVLPVPLEDNVEMLGYDLSATQSTMAVQQNQDKPLASTARAELVIYWKAAGTPAKNYSVFVHLVDKNGKIVAQHDGVPQNGNAPTAGWVTGEVVADLHVVSVEQLQSAGPYFLRAGMYDTSTNRRLNTAAGDHIEFPTEVWFGDRTNKE